MLTFDPVDINSVDWAAEINNYPERTIFQAPAWLSFIAKTQNALPVFAALREGQHGTTRKPYSLEHEHHDEDPAI